MSGAGQQTLRVLDGSYVLDRLADGTEVIPRADVLAVVFGPDGPTVMRRDDTGEDAWSALWNGDEAHDVQATGMRSEEHTSELQSQSNLVCRLLLEKKKHNHSK